MAVSQVIWRDTYYTSTEDSLSYTIQLDGSVIFSGKAFKAPDASYLYINISKICANFLAQDIDGLLSGTLTQTNTEAFRIFELVDGDGITLETYRFLYGWNYGEADAAPESGASITLSNPVNGHYSGNQWKPFTRFAFDAVTTSQNSNADYDTEVLCGKYAIIYLNALGGWDTFLFEGYCKKSDNITQYTTDRSFNNQTPQFEANRYISEISTSYELNTGWLTDEQAENFAWNVVNSNKVYLHNLVDDKVIPAVITDTAVNYQTYETNGRKLAQYTLKLKESQTKIRR